MSARTALLLTLGQALLLTLVLALILAPARPASAMPARLAQAAQQNAPGVQALTPDDLLRRRVEALSRRGRNSEAISLLEDRRDEGNLPSVLARRLVRLYRDTERWQDVETLLLQLTPDEADMDFGDLRQLADARHRLGRQDEAARTLERAINLDATNPSRIAVIANIYAQWGDEDRAIEVLLQSRERLGDPLEFAQSLSRHYMRAGNGVEAVRETCKVVAAGPLNLAIMRGQIVQLAEDYSEEGPGLLEAARQVEEQYPTIPQLSILIAELALSIGAEEQAWERLRPLVSQPALGQDLLRIAIAGLADSRLPDADDRHSLTRLRLSVRIARGLLGNETLPRALEPRAHDTLVRSLIAILDNKAFGELDPDERRRWLDESRVAVLEMNELYPGNRLAAAATLRLAEVYSAALGDPAKAIELYGAVAGNSSASAEDILTARLGIARAFVVAGDTLQARQDFTRIGADRSQPEGQNRAHYNLGLLDFMGGEYAEAAERMEAVALRAPRAQFSNDALDLAILIAEEQFNGEPDEEGLRQYGVMLYQRATHQRSEMTSTLEGLAERPLSPVTSRSRLDLVELYQASGEFDSALIWADRIVEESPASRAVAEALDLRAALLLELDRPEQARESWQRILLEHEDYVMVDRVRDNLGSLREPDKEVREGEVP